MTKIDFTDLLRNIFSFAFYISFPLPFFLPYPFSPLPFFFPPISLYLLTSFSSSYPSFLPFFLRNLPPSLHHFLLPFFLNISFFLDRSLYFFNFFSFFPIFFPISLSIVLTFPPPPPRYVCLSVSVCSLLVSSSSLHLSLSIFYFFCFCFLFFVFAKRIFDEAESAFKIKQGIKIPKPISSNSRPFFPGQLMAERYLIFR